jgi:hypothetical protein
MATAYATKRTCTLDPGINNGPQDIDIIRRLGTQVFRTPGTTIAVMPWDKGVTVVTPAGKLQIAEPQSDIAWDLARKNDIDYTNRKLGEVGSFVLERVSREVAYAAATDNSRPVLSAVCWEYKGWESGIAESRFTAADGFRLSTFKVGTGLLSDPFKLLIHASAWKYIAALKGNFIQVYTGYGTRIETLIFVGENGAVYTQCIPGEYVNIDRVIPSDSFGQFEVSARDMVDILKQIEPIYRESANITKWAMEPGEHSMLFITAKEGIDPSTQTKWNATTRKYETPKADKEPREMSLSPRTWGTAFTTGDAFKSAYNAAYIKDIAATCKHGDMLFMFKSPGSPLVIHSGLDYGTLNVVMPMYLANQ